MSADQDLIKNLTTLNKIAETLNQAVDVRSALESTLVRLLKQAPHDYLGACKQILRWNMAGGRVLPGLVKRREAEYRMCMGDA